MTEQAYLVLGATLFSLGALGVVLRPTAYGAIIAVQLMLGAAAFTFVSAAARFGDLDGQIAGLVVLVVAVAQVAGGIAVARRSVR